MSPVAAHSFDRMLPEGAAVFEFNRHAKSVPYGKADQSASYPFEVHFYLNRLTHSLTFNRSSLLLALSSEAEPSTSLILLPGLSAKAHLVSICPHLG